MSNLSAELPAHSVLPEPHLLFANSKRNLHPLCGLIEHGPYGSDIRFPTQVRVAYFAPAGLIERLDSLISELSSSAHPKEALNYYPPYPGFEQIFRIPLIQPPENLKSSANDDCLKLVNVRNGPGLVDSIIQSMASLFHQRQSFDVLFIYGAVLDNFH